MSKGYLSELTPWMLPPLTTSRKQHHIQDSGFQRQLLPKLSREFESTRQYTPEEPASYIDWKVYAKTDQLLSRQKIRHSPNSRWLLLDSSSTMKWPEDSCSKRELAGRIFLDLMSRSSETHDQWRFGVWKDHRVYQIKPLTTVECHGFFTHWQERNFSPKVFEETIFRKLDPDALSTHEVILISDGLDLHRDSRWQDLALKRFDCLLCMSHKELSFKWLDQNSYYVDGIQSTIIQKKGDSIKREDELSQAIEIWQNKIQQQCQNLGGRLLVVHDHLSLDAYFVGLKDVLA